MYVNTQILPRLYQPYFLAVWEVQLLRLLLVVVVVVDVLPSTLLGRKLVSVGLYIFIRTRYAKNSRIHDNLRPTTLKMKLIKVYFFLTLELVFKRR